LRPAAKKAKKGANDEGGLEHANAAGFTLAGESSHSGAAFAAAYSPSNWGNPGSIRKEQVRMFLFCLVMFLMDLFSLV
jgi:hypothetical protein